MGSSKSVGQDKVNLPGRLSDLTNLKSIDFFVELHRTEIKYRWSSYIQRHFDIPHQGHHQLGNTLDIYNWCVKSVESSVAGCLEDDISATHLLGEVSGFSTVLVCG